MIASNVICSSVFLASSSPDNATESCLGTFFVEYRPRIDNGKRHCLAVSSLPHALAVLPREESSRYPLNRTCGRPHLLPTFRNLVTTDYAVPLFGYCELFGYLVVQMDEVGKVRSLRGWHRNFIRNVSRKASSEETA
jgi:hypothetical protein